VLRVAVVEARGQFGSQDEKERPPMEAVNRKPIETVSCVSKRQIYAIINPNLVNSYSYHVTVESHILPASRYSILTKR
jgi:hypothetical protein